MGLCAMSVGFLEGGKGDEAHTFACSLPASGVRGSFSTGNGITASKVTSAPLPIFLLGIAFNLPHLRGRELDSFHQRHAVKPLGILYVSFGVFCGRFTPRFTRI